MVPDDELLAEAWALARRLAEGATLALAATKRMLWDGVGATVDERLPEELWTVADLSGTYDALEGLAAVIASRPPLFEGR